MEPNINYDEYDAYIHDYDYHTGFPKITNNSEETNLLNSIEFILTFKKKNGDD
jgi:hypothetical protein